MKQNDRIKLEKIEAHPTPRYPTPESKDYIPGQDNYGKSLPVGYTMEGVLLADIQIGKSLYMLRYKRNDVPAVGEVSTSAIEAINGDILLTKNSMYRLTALDSLDVN